MNHELKIKSEYFRQVRNGNKKAEIRYDDRDFMIGDMLVLKEWLATKKRFSGKEIRKKITAITWLYRVISDVDPKWCVLSMGDE